MDIMLDLETTGVSAGCCILSIGATSFDERILYYSIIQPSSCRDAGLKDFPATMAWWSKQSAEARMEAFSGTDPLVVALGQFSDFLRTAEKLSCKPVFLWGNGADFDLPILKAAYEAVGMEVPWKPYNGRCYRTLKNLWPEVKADDFEGLKHNALADAVYQARHALKILRTRKAERIGG